MPNSRNPLYHVEAGNHPLPSDEREIAAALRAGQRCLEAYPYFGERYGARGEAFTRSDSGYLTTLADHSQSHVDNQVAWLAGILSSRGMPRWLMEEHLNLLYEELSTAIPARVTDYRKLLQAAQVLREARLAWVPQADFDALVTSFESNAGAGLGGIGELVVAAVCDECCGLTEAVPSLISWLGDPGRFSTQWCGAVVGTLARARNLATHWHGKPI